MYHLMTCGDAPTCTWTDLTIPTLVGVNDRVPNDGRNLSNSSYRGLDEEDYCLYIRCTVIRLLMPVIFEGFVY